MHVQMRLSSGGVSSKLLQVSLRDQAFHIALSDIELAIFRQVDGPTALISARTCRRDGTARGAWATAYPYSV